MTSMTSGKKREKKLARILENVCGGLFRPDEKLNEEKLRRKFSISGQVCDYGCHCLNCNWFIGESKGIHFDIAIRQLNNTIKHMRQNEIRVKCALIYTKRLDPRYQLIRDQKSGMIQQRNFNRNTISLENNTPLFVIYDRDTNNFNNFIEILKEKIKEFAG
ncbi:MAG: hypothetical protein ACTSVY_15175 [Candidatus Helarchaeota archaeon]